MRFLSQNFLLKPTVPPPVQSGNNSDTQQGFFRSSGKRPGKSIWATSERWPQAPQETWYSCASFLIPISPLRYRSTISSLSSVEYIFLPDIEITPFIRLSFLSNKRGSLHFQGAGRLFLIFQIQNFND